MSAEKSGSFKSEAQQAANRNAVRGVSLNPGKDVQSGGPVQPDTITINNIVTVNRADGTVKVTGTYTCATGEHTAQIAVYVIDDGLLGQLGSGALGWIVLSAVTCNGQPQPFEVTVPSMNGTPFGHFDTGLASAELQTIDHRGVEVLEFVPPTSDIQNVTIVRQ
ncbi:hypothetical protein [Burkholderia ubonensis]|uniref:hypothetical protein n=1 Tax=Burkholderia ubonensis TaxID=101571 RepID=UPI000751F046|nr:hypothetical protein [Burkholderia ubonensis]KWN65868.1 hypothetical protein WM23_07730 [Burkholderia ubonensis]